VPLLHVIFLSESMDEVLAGASVPWCTHVAGESFTRLLQYLQCPIMARCPDSPLASITALFNRSKLLQSEQNPITGPTTEPPSKSLSLIEYESWMTKGNANTLWILGARTGRKELMRLVEVGMHSDSPLILSHPPPQAVTCSCRKEAC
jgi:hypothetical protein